MSGSRRLLPHERWAVRSALARQGSEPTATFRMWQQNYGPEGTELLVATLATAFPTAVLAFLGAILLGASGASGGLAVVAYCLVGVAVIAGVFAISRAMEASRAARQFRGGRPLSQ